MVRVEASTVTTLDKGRIFEVMSKLESNDLQPREDQLENLLDEQSDEEFRLPEFSEHVSESNGPVVLKDWTAQDFASIYVRFRPHLERHAKRYLVNPSQIEEVVQDAFLYLMTTLPELDSEIGVLKFLKWKTRLLALDVIRANSRVSLSPLERDREFQADLPESSQELERADDAAIVSLALAKLQPRHREALIATLYEEKSAALVSAQMGMSENAFRQLLFRSRAAFKKALIGEAETAGLSMSAVLSIAARKAAAESGKYISAAGAFLLVLGISIGVLPNLGDQGSQSVNLSTGNSFNEIEAVVPVAPETSGAEAEVELTAPLDDSEPSQPASVSEGNATSEPMSDSSSEPGATQSIIQEEPKSVAASSPDTVGNNQIALASEMRNTLNSAVLGTLAIGSSSIAPAEYNKSTGTIRVSSDSGVYVTVKVNPSDVDPIRDAWFAFNVNGTTYVAVPQGSYSERIGHDDGSVSIDYLATGLAIADSSGSYGFAVISDSEVSSNAYRLRAVFGQDGSLVDASLEISARD